MHQIEYVKGNPNPKAATFHVDFDFLKSNRISIGKIIIPKTATDILQYSRLAKALYVRGGDANRIDFANQGDGTLITISRKMMEFTDQNKDFVKTRLHDLFNNTEGFVPLDLQAIADNVEVQPALDLSGHDIKKIMYKAFKYTVTPMLEKDGGAMELRAIDYDETTGDIMTKVALIGSCSNCMSSETYTLKNAFEQMTGVLNGLKKKYENHARFQDYQKMTVRDIVKEQVAAMVFDRSQ